MMPGSAMRGPLRASAWDDEAFSERREARRGSVASCYRIRARLKLAPSELSDSGFTRN